MPGAAALGLIAVLAGCGDGDSDGAPTAPGPTPTFTCPLPDSTPTDAEQFGAVAQSAEQIALSAKCLAPGALSTAASLSTPPPRATIPPTLLPPVQAQGTAQHLGSPGSCETWSAGYAMGSYTANLTNRQPLSDPANAVSPGFLYPFVLHEEGKTCGEGTAASDTLDYLVSHSAPSLAAVPYSPSCTCLDMVDIDQTFVTDLMIGSWCYLPTTADADTLASIKAWIAQGHVVQTSIVVPWEFPDYTGGVFEAPTGCPTPAPTPTKPSCAQHGPIACIASTAYGSGCAQHGVAIVGYDDTKVGRDGQTGALRIMNSFGTDWGEKGFMWMSYATFEAIYFAGTVAFPPQPSGGLGAPAAVVDAFQWVEGRAGETPRTHLVFEAAFAQPLAAAEIAVTAPEGRTVRHTYAQPLRHGYVYLTRRDGRQFETGTYTVEIHGADGELATQDVAIDLDADSDLPPAALPDDLTGSNGQPVSFDSAASP